MTKRIFTIEWPDDLGPLWMNKDNLLLCLNAYCENIPFITEDVSDKIATALLELGVPTTDYPAPVSNARDILAQL